MPLLNPSWVLILSFFYNPFQLQAQLLESSLESENLTDDNMYACENCQTLTNAIKVYGHIETAPRYLTIHLKRFSFNAKTGISRKVNSR